MVSIFMHQNIGPFIITRQVIFSVTYWRSYCDSNHTYCTLLSFGLTMPTGLRSRLTIVQILIVVIDLKTNKQPPLPHWRLRSFAVYWFLPCFSSSYNWLWSKLFSNKMSHFSGGSRIFLRGGANSQCACANLLFYNFFCKKLHENERICTPGACVHCVPLGSTNALHV